MTPSLGDPEYQRSMARPEAWLGFDMIGMDYFFPQDSQSPCDAEIAAAVVSHIEAGYGGRLLLSGDVFLRMMLVRHGGFGYAHVVTTFADRLRRHGLDDAGLAALFVRDPAMLFETARRADGGGTHRDA